jgi:thiamine pyrophosphate-dependent acetolactate synthase large subunit-like protein
LSLRGADVLARTLAAAGVKQVFALSGNHVMPVFDAALDARLSLLHVRHEAAAVHMADAWGRLTGEPGIALVTGGPGHANALGALYTALAAQSPMVLISGHAPLDELGKGAFQEMPQAELAKPLTVASWSARAARGAQRSGASQRTERRAGCAHRVADFARGAADADHRKNPAGAGEREASAGHRRPRGDAHSTQGRDAGDRHGKPARGE